jgi:hypothetical protein
LNFIWTFSAKRLQIERLELGIWYDLGISKELLKSLCRPFAVKESAEKKTPKNILLGVSWSRRNAQLLAKRAQGQILGKPKGTLQKSKFDQNLEKIKELLGYGLSVRKIARVLGYTSHIALNTYINKRGLHQTVEA